MISPEVFIVKIKPLVDKFLKCPTKENVYTLRKELEVLETVQFPQIQNYILVPLVLNMDRLGETKGTSEIRCELLETFHFILSKVHLRQLSALKTLLVVCLKQIYDFNKGHVQDDTDEELKLCAVRCIKIALVRSPSDIIEQFYTKEHNVLIGKIALCCVEILDREKYRKLRIEAIHCLITLFYAHDAADFNDNVLRNQVASLVFIFIPKIVKSLIDVINGDEKQGQELISTAILGLHRILWLIFEDYEKENTKILFCKDDFANLLKSAHPQTNSATDDEILGNNIKQQSMEDRFKKLQSIQRDTLWLGASSRKLKPVLALLNKLRSNSYISVRKEYLRMCSNLLQTCPKYLNENIPNFLETVIALSQDEDVGIQEECKDCIKRLEHLDIMPTFMNEVEDLFDIYMIRFPRIIHRRYDVEQQSELMFLKGFLSLLSHENLTTIFSSEHNLHSLCKLLISLFELEATGDFLEENCAFKDPDSGNIDSSSAPWRKHKNIDGKTVLTLAEDICAILGSSGVVEMLFDRFMEIYETNVDMRNEIILILVFMVTKNLKRNSDVNVRLTRIILEQLLKEYHWHLALSVSEANEIRSRESNLRSWHIERTPGLYESALEVRISDIDMDDERDERNENVILISDIKFNVAHTSIVLDAVGHFSLILGNDIRPYLLKTLPKILEKAGNRNAMVHKAAFYCLQNLKTALNYSEIFDMLCEFSDYIAFGVYSSLKKIHENKSALDTLSSLLRYGSLKSVTYMENIILHLLEESSRPEHTSNIYSFLAVFHTFLSEVTNFIPNVENQEPIDETDDVDIYASWEEILQQPTENHLEDEEQTEDISSKNHESKGEVVEDEDMENQAQESKEQLPKYIELVIKIIKGIVKFTSSSDKSHKIKSLECLTVGLPLLKDYENELLPIVHIIYSPLAERFKDKDPVILDRCFSLLEVLATHAKDFLLQRSIKDVIPFLNDFLRKTSNTSTETMESKLQLKLLKKYPVIITNMEVSAKDLDAVLESGVPYLSKAQSKSLQKNAVEFFRNLSLYDCACVFVKLLNLTKIECYSHNAVLAINDILK